MAFVRRIVGACLVLASLTGRAADDRVMPDHLQVAVVQMSLGRTLDENRDRIIRGISDAAQRGARVAVFPEGALRGAGNDVPANVSNAVARISAAARERSIYVLFGGAGLLPAKRKEVNWMRVIGPDGQSLLHYEKLYDNHAARMPGVFFIDGIPCSTVICADRWLRGVTELPIQQGAKITFELSCNLASEWVEPLGWYWYVPRAWRNNVWVIFANTGNKVSGRSESGDPADLRHGHSVIIAPDGQIAAAANDDAETIVMGRLDVSKATGDMARERATNAVLKPFWDAGLQLADGTTVTADAAPRLTCAPTEITLAVAKHPENVAAMEALIAEAAKQRAHLVVFPERCAMESSLDVLKAAARRHRIAVVFGADHSTSASQHFNSAFVVGPSGALLTRYDQISAVAPFSPGTNAAAMWFRVKGVPAVVTVGRDALWTELAELAAVAGAQIHVHLDRNEDSAPAAPLRRLQIQANMASFMTFTACADGVAGAIWDDLKASEETRAEVRRLPRPDTGKAAIYSPFSANLVVQAKPGQALIVATRGIGKANPYHPSRTSSFNPRMEPWYQIGAALIHPQE